MSSGSQLDHSDHSIISTLAWDMQKSDADKVKILNSVLIEKTGLYFSSEQQAVTFSNDIRTSNLDSNDRVIAQHVAAQEKAFERQMQR